MCRGAPGPAGEELLEEGRGERLRGSPGEGGPGAGETKRGRWGRACGRIPWPAPPHGVPWPCLPVDPPRRAWWSGRRRPSPPIPETRALELLLFAAAAIRISVPYALAALGASINERGGVINIALEGMMLHGALAYTLGAFWTGNPWVGVAAAVVAGVLTGALHALVTVRWRADQITSGLGINLLAIGLTKFVLKAGFASSSNSSRGVGLEAWAVAGLSRPPAR